MDLHEGAVRAGDITPHNRRRWAVKAAVAAFVVLLVTPLLAVAADAVMEVPLDGFTAAGLLALFLVLALLVLVVANVVWATGGQSAPRARWLPTAAGGLALVGVVVAGLQYDPGTDRLAPLMVLVFGGTGFAMLLAQSVRISRGGGALG